MKRDNLYRIAVIVLFLCCLGEAWALWRVSAMAKAMDQMLNARITKLEQALRDTAGPCTSSRPKLGDFPPWYGASPPSERRPRMP